MIEATQCESGSQLFFVRGHIEDCRDSTSKLKRITCRAGEKTIQQMWISLKKNMDMDMDMDMDVDMDMDMDMI